LLPGIFKFGINKLLDVNLHEFYILLR